MLKAFQGLYIPYDEYGKKNTAKVDLRKKKKNTAVFELVQLIVITRRAHTCMVFLDPYIKGLLFINFRDRYVVRGPNRRTEPKISDFEGVPKAKKFELL